jgi:hypothetical protein
MTLRLMRHADVIRAAYAAFAKLPLSHASDYHVAYGGIFHWTVRAEACGNGCANAVPSEWTV